MGILNLINYFPQEGQIVRFDYISMIFVAIIIVALIIGVIKGLFSSLLSLASTLGSILISCVLCGYVGKLFYASSMGEAFSSLAYNWISNTEIGMFTEVITPENKEILLKEAYGILKIPEVMHSLLNGIVAPLIPEGNVESIATILSKAFSEFACMIISFIIISVIFFIVFKLLSLIAKKLNKIPVLGPINRIFGGLLGFASGIMICFVVSYILSLFLSTGIEFGNVLSTWMGIGDEGKWTISKVFYEINLIPLIIDLFI